MVDRTNSSSNSSIDWLVLGRFYCVQWEDNITTGASNHSTVLQWKRIDFYRPLCTSGAENVDGHRWAVGQTLGGQSWVFSVFGVRPLLDALMGQGKGWRGPSVPTWHTVNRMCMRWVVACLGFRGALKMCVSPSLGVLLPLTLFIPLKAQPWNFVLIPIKNS